ncbi:MAG: hypothetical protein V2J62_03305 [candidate division KSB1 bacterium]|nr:hypothetical protein [candidate division KSB1 bacterium]
MLMKPQKIRKFTYRPKYYKPDEPEEESRITFRRHRHSQKSDKRSSLGMIILIAIILFLIFYWVKMDSPKRSDFRFEEVIIEEIE